MVDPANLMSRLCRSSERLAPQRGWPCWRSVPPRAAVRAGIGAIEGTAGAAMLEPATYALSRAEQRDYTMADSLANLAFGGIMGGGLHAGFGASEIACSGFQADRSGSAQREAGMLGDAVTATLEGREVRADLPFREHLLSGTSLRTSYESAMLGFDTHGSVRPTGTCRYGHGRGPAAGVEAPHPVPDRTGAAVPILNDRNQPFHTRRASVRRTPLIVLNATKAIGLRSPRPRTALSFARNRTSKSLAVRMVQR